MFSNNKYKTGVNSQLGTHFLRCDEISRERLQHFRDKKQFSDIILDVFGTQIFAHKVRCD